MQARLEAERKRAEEAKAAAVEADRKAAKEAAEKVAKEDSARAAAAAVVASAVAIGRQTDASSVVVNDGSRKFRPDGVKEVLQAGMSVPKSYAISRGQPSLFHVSTVLFAMIHPF